MKVNIGNVIVSQLKPQAKPYDVRDNKLIGLIIRVNITGKMVYMCEYARGKRIMIGKVGVLTPIQARDRAKEILADYTKGIDPRIKLKSSRCSTLLSYIENEYTPWFRASKKSVKSLNNLKHFTNIFGIKALTEISPLIVEKWRTRRLEEKIKPATVNRNIVALKAAFTKALEWGIIEFNPLAKFKLLKVDNTGNLRYLTDSEEIHLRKAIDCREKKLVAARKNANLWREERGYEKLPSFKDELFVDYMKPMIILSLNTGIRRGELLSLTWENVNFSLATLTVTGQNAKSGKTRHIPLNSEAINVLKTWQKQTKEITGIVFRNKIGNQFSDIKKAWGTILKIANIKNFRWHDIRHHFASRLVMAGVDLNTVRELLGHSDIKMTLRYAHLAPEYKASAVAKLIRYKRG